MTTTLPPPAQAGRVSGTASFSISVSSASCARMPETFGWPLMWERILSTSSTKTSPEAARRSSMSTGAVGPSCSRARSRRRPSTASPGRPRSASSPRTLAWMRTTAERAVSTGSDAR